MSLEKEILKTIGYFGFFAYAPAIDEIYTFFPLKTTKKNLKKQLEDLIEKKKLIKNNDHLPIGHGRGKLVNLYTLPPYSIFFSERIVRARISQEKIKKIGFYLRLLSLFPQIKLIGLSGTIAMMNAKEEDDVDLFVITARNRLWTGRFIVLILAQFLGIRRKWVQKSQKSEVRTQTTEDGRQKAENIKDKVCLNLFFEESDLAVPDFKKTEYVAHEILQMKPLVNKNGVYERFLAANLWIYKMFPNAGYQIAKINPPAGGQISKTPIKYQKYILYLIWIFNIIQDWWENILKKFQLYFIRKHQTTEIITDSQLWFHPDDFEKRMPKTLEY